MAFRDRTAGRELGAARRNSAARDGRGRGWEADPLEAARRVRDRGGRRAALARGGSPPQPMRKRGSPRLVIAAAAADELRETGRCAVADTGRADLCGPAAVGRRARPSRR